MNDQPGGADREFKPARTCTPGIDKQNPVSPFDRGPVRMTAHDDSEICAMRAPIQFLQIMQHVNGDRSKLRYCRFGYLTRPIVCIVIAAIVGSVVFLFLD